MAYHIERFGESLSKHELRIKKRQLREEILSYKRKSIYVAEPILSNTNTPQTKPLALTPFYDFRTVQDVLNAPDASDSYESLLGKDSIPYSPATALFFFRTKWRLENNGEGLPEVWKSFEIKHRDKLKKFPKHYKKTYHRSK